MPRRLDLFPDLIAKDWWGATNYPRQLLNQKIATVLVDEDLSNSDVHKYKGFKVRPRMPASVKASGTSEVKIDENGFQVSLDIDEYELEELSVERIARFIEIRGKQEEKKDEYGLISREFARRYMIPNNCDMKTVTSVFTVDGKLIIKIPKGEEQSVPNPVVISPEDSSFQKSAVEQQTDQGPEKVSSHDESYTAKEKSLIV